MVDGVESEGIARRGRNIIYARERGHIHTRVPTLRFAAASHEALQPLVHIAYTHVHICLTFEKITL